MSYTVGLLAILGLLLVFLQVWGLESRRLMVMTPFLIFAGHEFLRNWIVAYLAPSLGLSQNHHALVVFLASFAGFLFGFVLCVAMLRYRPSLPAEYRATPLQVRSSGAYAAAVLGAALVLCLLGMYLYQGLPPVVQAIRSLTAGADEQVVARFVAVSRKTLTKSHYFGGEYRGQGLLRSVMQMGWTYLSGISLALYLGTRRLGWLAATAVILVAAFVFVAGDGTRGPFLWLLVYLLILTSFARVITYPGLAMTVAVGVGAAIGLSLTSSKLQSLLDSEQFAAFVMTQVGERVVVGNGGNTVRAIELVQTGSWELRHGDVHIRSITNVLPGVSNEPFASQLFRTLAPGSQGTTYSSPSYLAETYVDFGLPGSVIIYMIMGFGVGLAQWAMLRVPKTPLLFPLVAYAALILGRLPMTGPTPLASTLVIALPLWFGMRFVYSLLRRVPRPVGVPAAAGAR